MIQLQGITKVYPMGKRELTVLNGITLDIEQGELVAIMGPSGSGKSTMLNLIGAGDKKTVFLLGERDDIVYKSSRNINRLSVNCVAETTTYDIMNSDVVVFTRSAIDRVKEVFEA